MKGNVNIRYKKYSQLISEIKNDFRKYDSDGYISPGRYIKVIKKLNYELGFKLGMKKQKILKVENHKVRLPEDLMIVNFALIVSDKVSITGYPMGFHTENVPIKELNYIWKPGRDIDNPCNSCDNKEEPPVECNDCELKCDKECEGEEYVVVQDRVHEYYRYRTMQPIRLKKDANMIIDNCMNYQWGSCNTGWIENGWLYTNFESGELYLNYFSILADEDGELMIIDHDGINQYYEYAIKAEILEDMIMNGENVTDVQFKLVNSRLEVARREALSLVNTIEFSDIKKYWAMNRLDMYKKYFYRFA